MRTRRFGSWFVLAFAVLLAACSAGENTGDVDGLDSQVEDADSADGGDEGAGDAEATATDTEDAGSDSAALFDIDAVLAADPDCLSPVEGEPLLVGYAADLSELGAFADAPASDAAIHMANLINCSGGLAGRPVQVTVTDISGQDPLISRDGTRGLLDQGASVLLGPPFPDPGFRVLNVADGEVPVLFTGSTEPALGNFGNLSFLVAYSDTEGAGAAAQFAQSQGWSNAATFTAPGPYFGYHPRVFATAFQDLGGTVLTEYPFVPLDQTDFSAEAADMVANPPDVIYSGMLANQWVALRAALDEAGLTDVELIGSDAFEATNGYSLTGTDGIYHVTHTDPGADTRLEVFVESFSQANGLPPASRSMAALAGDAMAVVAEAYLQTLTLDPAELGQAIGTLDRVEGVSGVLSYDRSGTPNKPLFVHQVVDGQPSLAAVIGR